MKLSEAASKAIDLASKIYDYYSVELPKRHPNYPLVGPDDEETPPPPEEKQLQAFLEVLSDDLLYQLLLLIHLARGNFGTDALAENYASFKSAPDGRSYAVSMLMHPSLADYLVDGLEELRQRGIDVDKMPLKKVKVRKG